jgi:hypothetical protein
MHVGYGVAFQNPNNALSDAEWKTTPLLENPVLLKMPAPAAKAA